MNRQRRYDNIWNPSARRYYNSLYLANDTRMVISTSMPVASLNINSTSETPGILTLEMCIRTLELSETGTRQLNTAGRTGTTSNTSQRSESETTNPTYEPWNPAATTTLWPMYETGHHAISCCTGAPLTALPDELTPSIEATHPITHSPTFGKHQKCRNGGCDTYTAQDQKDGQKPCA